jgi:simple sugar transport system permease protein
MVVTAGLVALLFAAGSNRYRGFFDLQVLLNLFIDNSFLLVVAIGMTFVILTGGIDLSVGAVAGFTTMFCAWLIALHGWPAPLVMALALGVGTLAGYLMGLAIHHLRIQPFIVTLAGLFLFRGLCFVLSTDSISIGNDFITSVAQTRIPLGEHRMSVGSVVALIALVIAALVLRYTKFGRNVYAIGGSEPSALLMGLPVARVKVGVYALSGFCSALAGLLYVLYTQSGDGVIGIGLELDAIAVVVIGGTLLTGGAGNVLGTLLGVLVLGLVKTIISFEGTLSSWWTKIFVGTLLLTFILLQRTIGAGSGRPRSTGRELANDPPQGLPEDHPAGNLSRSC